MNTQQNAFFFEIQQIPEDSKIFDELQNQQLFFSYFQVDQNYYLFFYQQKFIDIDQIEPFIDILEELDTKQRKIRSLRGFFLYILEIMDDGKDLQILRTNLQPSFWRKLRKILRQNKKVVLLEFLFGSQGSTSQTHLIKKLEEKIQIFENQIASLQEKGLNLVNFIILGNILEQEKIEIIKIGFRLNQEGKISLKKYYESTDPYSLYQLKGYNIKYETIRRTTLYQNLKE